MASDEQDQYQQDLERSGRKRKLAHALAAFLGLLLDGWAAASGAPDPVLSAAARSLPPVLQASAADVSERFGVDGGLSIEPVRYTFLANLADSLRKARELPPEQRRARVDLAIRNELQEAEVGLIRQAVQHTAAGRIRRSLGVSGTGPCPQCAALEGVHDANDPDLYWRHPNCVCSWGPEVAMNESEQTFGEQLAALLFSDVSQEERDQAVKDGNALPDGSYPITSKARLHSAIILAQSGHGDVAAAKRLIRKRAKELDAEDMLPEGFGEPDAGDLHLDQPVNSERPTRAFLTKLRELLKDKVLPQDFDEAWRAARAHAGGMARSAAQAASRQNPSDPTGAQAATEDLDDSFLFAEPLYFMDPPQRIPYLPRPGTYVHPRYGKVVITRERNQRFVDNFQNHVYQEELPIDAEHMTKLSGACGYITQLLMNEDGSVDALVRWTDRGQTLLRNDRFSRFSPEYYEEWQQPDTGDIYKDVAIGGALTTRSFFKSKSLRPLAASENVLVGYFAPRAEEQEMAEDKGRGDGGKADDDKEDDDEDESMDTGGKQANEQRFTEVTAENARLKAMVEEQAEANKRFSEKFAEMERVERRRQFSDEVYGRVEGGRRWYGDPDEHLDFMESLHTAGLEDKLQKYIERERAHAEQMHAAGLFSERGRAGSAPGGSVVDKLEGMIASRMSEKGESKLDAMSAVFAEHPEMYAQYNDSTVNAGTASGSTTIRN